VRSTSYVAPGWQALSITDEPTRPRPDEDAIYQQVGRFVVTFQALENELLQLASYALDPDQTGRGRHEAAGLWFGQLVSKTSEAVDAFLTEHRPADEMGVRGRLDGLLTDCRELGRQRNRVVHSAYLFLEGGDELVAIVRSDMTRGDRDNEVEFDQEALNETTFNRAMTSIAETAFGIGQCRLQLIHWYQPRDT
jgi:hypothetical protein